MYFSCSNLPHCFEIYVKFRSPHVLSEVHRSICIIQLRPPPHFLLIHPYIIACLMLTSSKNSESTAKYQLYLEKLCWFLFFQNGKFSLNWVNLFLLICLLFCLYMSVISILISPGLPGELLGEKMSVILYLQVFFCHSGLKQNIAHHNSSLISFFRLLGM